LVLDCAPPRALLVDGVEEVADLATAPFFRFPAGTVARSLSLVRGAVLHGEHLILELIPQALADFRRAEPFPAPVALEALPQPRPEKALLFTAGAGELFGAPLPLVTGVLRAKGRCYVPLAPPGHTGLIHHERSLLPIFDLARLVARPPTVGELAVVLDVGGSAAGAAAIEVFGVCEGFAGEPLPEKGGVRWRTRDGRKVFIPDFERLFPSAR
jgi:chemotaxis signal transduction protein